MVIDKNGKATVSFPRKGNTLRNRNIQNCIRKVIENFPFPPQDEKAEATLPMIF
jgi:hypothetical protein